MAISLFLYALVVLGLLIAELREDRRAQFFFKPLAAFGFVLLALQFGALETLYGQLILAGLLACALGDLLLLPKGTGRKFEIGIAAFAISHILFAIAFTKLPSGISTQFIVVALLSLIGYLVFKKLKPFLDESMFYAVGVYIFIIMAMLSFAFASQRYLPITAAVMFSVSDMFVARDRFVKPNSKNALAITPLYFGAQALFALSTTL